MKQLTVFHRIFSDDLQPTENLVPMKRKEYIDFLLAYQKTQSTPLPQELKSFSDLSLQFHYCDIHLKNTMKSLKEDLYERVFVLGSDDESIQSLVHRMQHFIEMHLNRIKDQYLPISEHLYIFHFSENKDVIYDIYKLVYQELTTLENFLEVTFDKYINQTNEIPCKQRKAFIKTQQQKAERVIAGIETLEVDPAVKHCVSSAIHAFLNDRFKGFNRINKSFSQNFFSIMDRFFQQEQCHCKDAFLFALVRVNFNRNGMSVFLIEEIRKSLSAFENPNKKLKILNKYSSRIHQIEVVPSAFYNPKVLSLKKQCLDWLFHEKENILTELNNIKVNDPEPVEMPNTSSKHLLNLTVSEIGLFIRLIDESQIMSLERKNITNEIANNFYTKRSSKLSAESLYNHSYSVEERSKNKARRILKEMLQQLDNLE